jgi:hypothetical protein
LIVGDKDKRDSKLLLQCPQLRLHLLPKPFVERTGRFVQQEHLGFPNERACQRDVLPLSAGQLMREASTNLLQPNRRKCLSLALRCAHGSIE